MRPEALFTGMRPCSAVGLSLVGEAAALKKDPLPAIANDCAEADECIEKDDARELAGTPMGDTVLLREAQELSAAGGALPTCPGGGMRREVTLILVNSLS